MPNTPSRIHFVSRYKQRAQRGYNDLGGGLFTTEAWAVSEEAADAVQEVWLHNRKVDPSWRGGKVIDRVPVTVPGKTARARWRFVVREIPDRVETWPADTGGGPEKAYV
jgi:hypothetical protein